MEQRIIFSRNIKLELAEAISESEHDRIFVLSDTHTAQLCWPRISGFLSLKGARLLTIDAGDEAKNLDTLSYVWTQLRQGGATRHSMLINLGGGMVTDLGGFAASTYKRGINFINIPTSLLAMVDASVGGKTGINFGGLKNEVGVFNDSKFVIIDTHFLTSLDLQNLLSGYAEMIKHGLISDEGTWASLMDFDITAPDFSQMQVLVRQSVAVKERIVEADPCEKGLRKALNFGHTFGHALEEWSLSHAAPGSAPLLHGYAVAFGLICELWLSCTRCGFPVGRMRQTVSFIRSHYGDVNISCDDYVALVELMRHDKKNRAGEIDCTLLAGIGDVRTDQNLSETEIKEAFDFLREG